MGARLLGSFIGSADARIRVFCATMSREEES